jgi:hypothetical protein
MDFIHKDLSEARKSWKTFHQKDNPDKELTLNTPWPQKWYYAGHCVTMYYASNKWYASKKMIRYYHDHSDTVRCWHPRATIQGAPRMRPLKPPVRRFPTSGTVLGYCLGWDLETPKGELLRAVPLPKALLCCFPNRKVLFVVERGRVVSLVTGPKMTVEDVGIVN